MLKFRRKNNFNALILNHILEYLSNLSFFLKKIKNRFTKKYIEIPVNNSDQINHVRDQLKIDTLCNDVGSISELTRNTSENFLQKNKLKIINLVL